MTIIKVYLYIGNAISVIYVYIYIYIYIYIMYSILVMLEDSIETTRQPLQVVGRPFPC